MAAFNAYFLLVFREKQDVVLKKNLESKSDEMEIWDST